MSNTSGKLVILIIVALALAAAGTSWWFRYTATHKAAEFWGPAASRLIRDAPHVSLRRSYLQPQRRDISNAPGITHLRNALLEDRSFEWSQTIEVIPMGDRWRLEFSDPVTDEHLAIHFTADCRGAFVGDGGAETRAISTEPISAGLCEVFAELLPEMGPPPPPR